MQKTIPKQLDIKSLSIENSISKNANQMPRLEFL